jgi:DNA-binding transcriptional LysR family regulator
MRKLPPLASLRAFESAARHMSFKEAAAELGVTPTAISHQIRLLEGICGEPLFQRRPRPLALTGPGERLFPVLRNGLDAFATAIASISEGIEQRHRGRRGISHRLENAFGLVTRSARLIPRSRSRSSGPMQSLTCAPAKPMWRSGMRATCQRT